MILDMLEAQATILDTLEVRYFIFSAKIQENFDHLGSLNFHAKNHEFSGTLVVTLVTG